MSSYTVSASQGSHSERHSRREYTPDSADRALESENIVIYDCGDDRVHFNEFFKDSIEEYNAKQKRADRKKSLDYLSALENGVEGYGKGERQEKPFYHDVIQVGNRETNGVTKRTFDVDHWRQLKADGKFDEASEYVRRHANKSKEREDLTEVLKEVAEEIRDNKDGKYSNILLHGLTIHRDEPNGTDHLDMRYTFFVTDEKTGLRTRVSMTKALAAMGFKTDKTSTAFEKFRESIKDRIAEKMQERGYEREVKGEHRKHVSTDVYELEQRAKEAQKTIDAAATLEPRVRAIAKKEREQSATDERQRQTADRQTARESEQNAREQALQLLSRDLQKKIEDGVQERLDALERKYAEKMKAADDARAECEALAARLRPAVETMSERDFAGVLDMRLIPKPIGKTPDGKPKFPEPKTVREELANRREKQKRLDALLSSIDYPTTNPKQDDFDYHT